MPPKKRSTFGRGAKKKRQTTLPYTKAPSSPSPTTRSTRLSSKHINTAEAFLTPKHTRSLQPKSSPSTPTNSSNFEVVIPTPSRKSRVELTPFSSEGEPSSSLQLPEPPAVSDLDQIDEGDEDEDAVILPWKKRNNIFNKAQNSVVRSDPLLAENDSDNKSVPHFPRSTPIRKPLPQGLGAGLRFSKDKHSIQLNLDLADGHLVVEHEDVDPVITPARKRMRRTLKPVTLVDSSDEAIETLSLQDGIKESIEELKDNEGHSAVEEDDDDVPVSSVRRRRPSKSLTIPKKSLIDLDDSSDDENLNLAHNPVVESTYEDSDHDNLSEDVQLALETPTVNSRTRFAGSSPGMTSYQRRLQVLKAARAKKDGKEFAFTEENKETPKRPLYDSGDGEEEEEVGENDHMEGSNDSGGEGGEGGEDTDAGWDSELSDFIVHDDGVNDLIGAPEIPIEFTSASHEKMVKSFQIYGSYLIITMLLPSTPKPDNKVTFSLRRLQTQIESYRGSVLESSVWVAPFLRSMKAHPQFIENTCLPVDKCDACNRHDRHATHEVQFYGPRYDAVTLKDLEPDSDTDSSADSLGNSIPDINTKYYLGRHCFARTRLVHQFVHWKKQLRNQIASELVGRGLIDVDEKLSQNMSQEMGDDQKLAWAQDIADGMQGDLASLYYQFKAALKEARKLMDKQR